MNDKLWTEYEELVEKLTVLANKAGIQVAVYASGGHGGRGTSMNDEKRFMCPGTILSRIALAPRMFWGRMCRLATDIASPEEWKSALLCDIQDALIEIPERCVQLRCHTCGFDEEES